MALPPPSVVRLLHVSTLLYIISLLATNTWCLADEPADALPLHVRRVLGPIPVYWTSLRGSTARQARQKHQLSLVRHVQIDAVGDDWEGFDRFVLHCGASKHVAVDGGREMAKEEVKRMHIRDKALGRELKHVREVSCLLSHVKAVRAAYDRGEQVALFIEDDAWFDYASVWPKTLPDILASAPAGTKGVVLYNNHPYMAEVATALNVDFLPHASGATTSSMAYVLNRAGMAALLDQMYDGGIAALQKGKQVFRFPLQWYFADYYLYNAVGEGMAVWAQPLFVHDNSASTIEAANMDDEKYTTVFLGSAHAQLYLELRRQVSHLRREYGDTWGSQSRNLIHVPLSESAKSLLHPRTIRRIVQQVSREEGVSLWQDPGSDGTSDVV
ncbi:unnamed protein product [Pedinophyceae sp. YPF-701]|nr:unnamed protein product [Pedinophyceae sp. YPF-701]